MCRIENRADEQVQSVGRLDEKQGRLNQFQLGEPEHVGVVANHIHASIEQRTFNGGYGSLSELTLFGGEVCRFGYVLVAIGEAGRFCYGVREGAVNPDQGPLAEPFHGWEILLDHEVSFGTQSVQEFLSLR